MKTFKEYLGEDKKTWMKDGVEMCSKDCCGQPVTECTCGPECKHCDCYEKNKMNEGKYGKKKKYEAVGDAAAPIYDLIDELGSHQIVLDELIRYLDVDQIEDFVADFRRHNDMNEGRMKDQVIHDSETMSKEEFAKKHGKELADEMYEEADEAVNVLKKLAGL